MIKIEFDVDIERPVEEVFDFLTDTQRLTAWQSLIIDVREDTPGPLAKGSRYTHTAKFLGRRFDTTVEAVEIVPNERADFQTVTGPFPFRISHTLESTGTGTRLHVLGEGDPGGFFKLAEPLVARAAERQFKNDYTTLKELVEAQAQGG